MKKRKIIFAIFLIVFLASCQKEGPKAPSKIALEQLASTEVDVKKIEQLTGISLRILKTEALGYMPLNKFFWVSVPEKLAPEKIEKLAEAIIKQTILSRPRTYHSFTVHFFCEKELGPSLETSQSFAKATFLPEGSWAKVGRVPIDDYKTYQLTCSLREKMPLP